MDSITLSAHQRPLVAMVTGRQHYPVVVVVAAAAAL